MLTWGLVALAVYLAAMLFFFLRMRSVAREIDGDCLAMMNVALSLVVVIPAGLAMIGVGMAWMAQGGALLVGLASVISLAAGMVLVPVVLMNGIRRLKATDEERMQHLFD